MTTEHLFSSSFVVDRATRVTQHNIIDAPRARHMSLLRKAAKAFANQDIYKSRNAFVRPYDQDTVVQQYTGILRDADKRRDEGTSTCDNLGRAALTTLIGQERSAIDGYLIALKDNVCTCDGPTTCASAILKGFHSPYPATVVEKLEQAGALIAGKTNLDEFGMGYALGIFVAANIWFDI